MAGIYDRLRSVGGDHVSPHVLASAVRFVARGHFTGSQARDAVNATLVTPLNSAAETDLTDILAIMNGMAAGTPRVVYSLDVDAVFNCWEVGAMSESAGRGVLGI